MYGNLGDGSQIVERFISAMIADIILEHNKKQTLHFELGMTSNHIKMTLSRNESVIFICKKGGIFLTEGAIKTVFFIFLNFQKKFLKLPSNHLHKSRRIFPAYDYKDNRKDL